MQVNVVANQITLKPVMSTSPVKTNIDAILTQTAASKDPLITYETLIKVDQCGLIVHGNAAKTEKESAILQCAKGGTTA
jgi:hypothetical protein